MVALPVFAVGAALVTLEVGSVFVLRASVWCAAAAGFGVTGSAVEEVFGSPFGAGVVVDLGVGETFGAVLVLGVATGVGSAGGCATFGAGSAVGATFGVGSDFGGAFGIASTLGVAEGVASLF